MHDSQSRSDEPDDSDKSDKINSQLFASGAQSDKAMYITG